MAHKFSDGRKGGAITVRVIPRAESNEIVEILSDDSVKIRLACTADNESVNRELISFLASVFKVNRSKLEVVAGDEGRDKLVSILDLSTQQIEQRLLAALIK